MLFQEAEASLASLDFAPQIKIFRTGFALWQQNLKPPAAKMREIHDEAAAEGL